MASLQLAVYFFRYGKITKFYMNFYLQLMVKISPFLRLSAKVFDRFAANGQPHETFNKV